MPALFGVVAITITDVVVAAGTAAAIVAVIIMSISISIPVTSILAIMSVLAIVMRSITEWGTITQEVVMIIREISTTGQRTEAAKRIRQPFETI